jgi:Zn-finger nucleic acid-binding protein
MAYRGKTIVCVVCRVEMGNDIMRGVGFNRCATCDGVWIAGPALEELATKMGGAVAFTPREGSRARSCPTCGGALAHMLIAGAVPIDRCEAHGVWFDRDELGVTLAATYTDEKEWWRQFGELIRSFS